MVVREAERFTDANRPAALFAPHRPPCESKQSAAAFMCRSAASLASGDEPSAAVSERARSPLWIAAAFGRFAAFICVTAANVKVYAVNTATVAKANEACLLIPCNLSPNKRATASDVLSTEYQKELDVKTEIDKSDREAELREKFRLLRPIRLSGDKARLRSGKSGIAGR